jgi:hypothetical protein
MFEKIIEELSALQISTSKKRKVQMSILNDLCNGYLDSLSQQANLILPEIEDDSSDECCTQIAFQLERKMSVLSALVDSMMMMMISMTKTLEAVVKSDNFDLPVFQTFLNEFLVVLNLILSSEYATKLPVSWKFLRNISNHQVELFGRYIEAETYEQAHEIIWEMSNDTDSQKKVLERCMLESVGFEGVMSKVGAVLESMLLLQEEFILKLIARLQRSKNAEGSETLKWVTV